MENNKWGINSEKQNSHSINNNFQLNSNFHNYFNSHFFSISSNTHSLQNHIFLFLLHSILTFICFHFSLFLLFIVIVVPFSKITHYCIKWINVIDMPFFTHLKQTHWKQVLYSFKHVLCQLYTQNEISFQNHIHHLVFNNCLREGKEPTTEQPCHVEQWPLLRNKWINPPFFTNSTNSEIISF